MHCGQYVSSKIERLREHLKNCKEFALKHDELNSVMCLDDDIHIIQGDNQGLAQSQVQVGTSKDISTKIPNSPRKRAWSVSPLKRSTSALSDISTDSSQSCFKATLSPKIDKFIIKTTSGEKALIDLQIARAFYSCNIPFSVIENEHIQKVFSMLRGGSYKPPTRHDISGYLLDEIHTECEAAIASELEGQSVTLIQDGWSIIHNQPIIGSCLHNGTVAYFIRSLDAGSEKKTAEYCSKIAEDEIDYCEKKYKCKVRSLVFLIPRFFKHILMVIFIIYLSS